VNKRRVSGLILAVLAGLTLLGMAGLSHASLTTIGTATYGGIDYNLVYDNDNNGRRSSLKEHRATSYVQILHKTILPLNH